MTDHDGAEMRRLRTRLAEAMPLAERYCWSVLESESVDRGDGWQHWRTNPMHADTGDILGFMVTHRLIVLHETEPLHWKYADGACTGAGVVA